MRGGLVVFLNKEGRVGKPARTENYEVLRKLYEDASLVEELTRL
ncbi:MAG: hypothetical protein QOH49_3798 [Acidobacteriota bacterium]|jgi:hypothetical protein|nr:hypothetical protein [Acidobacteriota bacterium]